MGSNVAVSRPILGARARAVPAFLERCKTTHPLGRVGQPDEAAALILFLLPKESGWITGACMPIDGGRALASSR